MWGRKSEQPDDGVAWWMRFLARSVGTAGGIGAIIFGIWACVSLSAKCIAAGIIQMLCGFIVVVFEAPCCCMWLDFIAQVSTFSDGRPYWQKAVIYGGLSLPSVFMCPEVTTIVGAACTFVAAALYGLMALGKKGDADGMRMAAAGGGDKMGAPFVKQEVPPATSNLPV